MFERLFLHLYISIACLGASMCSHRAHSQEQADLKLGERFQVSVSYGVGDLSLEIEGARQLEQDPSSWPMRTDSRLAVVFAQALLAINEPASSTYLSVSKEATSQDWLSKI